MPKQQGHDLIGADFEEELERNRFRAQRPAP